jgi:hypothetical protein
MKNQTTINFTKEKVEELRKLYNHAVENKIELFQFEGNDILTEFAKYMLQYLDSKFKNSKLN